MALETATYINGLNASNPTATDPKSEGDDHIRLVKSTIKATFPSVSGAVTATHTELNYVDGVTSNIQTQFAGKLSLTGGTLTGVVEVADGTAAAPSVKFGGSQTGMYRPAVSQIGFSTAGTARFTITGSAISAISVDTILADIAPISEFSAGYRAIPQTTKNENYTFALIDSGQAIVSNDTSSYTYTVPPNADVNFPIGSVLRAGNYATSGVLTIAGGSGVTLRLAGTGATGSKSVAAWGDATIKQIATNVWLVDGPGVT